MGKGKGDEELLDADQIAESKWFRIYMTLIWIASLSVMVYYTVGIVQQHIEARRSPSSAIVISEMEALPFPQIVVCNWNQDGSIIDPTPTHDCKGCQIQLVSCTYNLTIDCMSNWSRVEYQTKGGLFYCWQYNYDKENPIFSETTGYSGAISTVWVVPENLTDMSFGRIGLQATLKPVGKVNETDIYNEINFAPSTFDTFFSFQYVNTIHNELDDSDPGHQVESYDASSSLVNLLTVPGTSQYYGTDGLTDAFVAVSFSFQTLSLQEVTFDIAYNLNNLFGDFTGMIGTLCGLDLIKLAAGLPMAYLAYHGKSCLPLQNAFNG